MAAGRSAVLTVQILTDASQASKGVQQATSAYERFQGGVNRLVPAATIAAGAITVLGTKAVSSASRTEQAMGALDSVFGKNSKTVQGWAADAARSVGLAQSEYGELASVIGAQLNNLGLSADAALAGTQNLITVGADLAATFGGSTSEAVSALSAALRGEADPAERYGLSLSKTAVSAYLAEKGLDKLKGNALKTAQTQAVLALATEQAGGALGQFGRESDTVSGQQQIAAAEFENASAALGERLLPIVAAVTSKLADFARWVSENSGLVLTLVGVVGGLAGGIIALSAAMKAITIVQKAWAVAQKAVTVAQWALNAAMNANPIGIIILAVVALVAAFVWLWNNVEGFRNFFIGVWEAIKVAAAAVADWFQGAWGAIVDWFQGAWQAVSDFFTGVWDAIKTAVGVVADWFSAVWGGIVGWFEDVWQGVADFFSDVWTGIQVVVGVVADWFEGIWDGIATFFENLVTGWGIVFDTVFGVIRGVVETVTGFFKNAWDTAVNGVTTIINTLKSIFERVFNAIRKPIDAVADAFKAVVDWVKSIIDWIGKIKIPDVFGTIAGWFGGGRAAIDVGYTVPTGAVARSPRLGATVAGAVPGGGGVVINVYGGLDGADTTARRVQQLLTGRERRTGGVVLKRRTTG